MKKIHSASVAEDIRLTDDHVIHSVSSNLFLQGRETGLICDSIAPILQMRDKTGYIVASIGKTFHVYDIEKLELLFVGPNYSSMYPNTAISISSLATCKDLTCVILAPIGVLSICERGKEIAVMRLESGLTYTQMQTLGDYVLLLSDKGTLVVVDLNSRTIISQDLISINGAIMKSFMHPSTYLNKILIADERGCLHLWNFKTNKRIHTYLAKFSEVESIASGVNTDDLSVVTAMVQTPALDIVAISLKNGFVWFLDVKNDILLFQLQLASTATCIAFRHDYQTMVTGHINGDLHVWDLDTKSILAKLPSAHSNCSITMAVAIPGRPIIITAAKDNSIKEWIFPTNSHMPELLKFRSGHCAPVSFISFYDRDGQFILSYGKEGSFRAISLFKDSQSFEFSQARANSRLAPACFIDSVIAPFSSRGGSMWDNIVTIHPDYTYAQSWSFVKKSIGSFRLLSTDKSSVSSLSISTCGHYCALGTSSGNVEVYNLQSGHQRGLIPASPGHIVGGLAFNSDTTTIASAVSIGDTELLVSFWCFKTRRLISQYSCNRSDDIMDKHVYTSRHIENDMVAFAVGCQVFLFDFSSKLLVRLFSAVRTLNSVSFSADGKWIISACRDGNVFIWDLLSGERIDTISIAPSVPTNAILSPNGAYLAITSDNSNSIYLWVNKCFYGLALTTTTTGGGSGDLKEAPPAAAMSNFKAEIDNDSSNFVRLSGVNSTLWNQLIHLDAIRESSRGISTLSQEKVPFFLSQDISSDRAMEQQVQQKAVPPHAVSLSDFEVLLMDESYDKLASFLKAATPSTIDYGIRTLSCDETRLKFISFMIVALQQKRDFDLLVAYVDIFLHSQQDAILANFEYFRETLVRLQSHLAQPTNQVESLLHGALGLIRYCSGKLL